MKLSTQEFHRVSAYVKTHFGINLTEKKRTLIETRLQHIMTSRSYKSYNDYFDHIINDATGKELTELLNSLTTNHTYFMREPEHFKFLTSVILPYILKHHGNEQDFRIWSAGCSSGQEPYSIAMLISEFLLKQPFDTSKWNRQMLATDLSEKALHKAVRGTYSFDEIKGLPKQMLEKYFTIKDNHYHINHTIQSEIVFRRFNLMNRKFPFKRPFHTIFCRNVMIYFDHETKHKLVEKFYDALVPGGFLLIGHSEFIDKNTSRFDYIKPAVYRKPGGVSIEQNYPRPRR